MQKKHISFSEVLKYDGCQYRHYLSYILGHKGDESIHLIFGSAVHDAIDAAKKNPGVPTWITMGKTIYSWIKKNPIHSYKNAKRKMVTVKLDPKEWTRQALGIYSEIFEWLDVNFPNYELVGSEIALYEPMPEIDDFNFKGFIDFFIKVDGVYHLIDFKTSSWGWDMEKRRDTKKQYQLTLYKLFLCRKMGIDPKLVKTHFLLLKRTPPNKKGHPGVKQSRIELVTISSGPKKMENANTWLVKKSKALHRGLKMKNRTACKWCPFHHTKLCP